MQKTPAPPPSDVSHSTNSSATDISYTILSLLPNLQSTLDVHNHICNLQSFLREELIFPCASCQHWKKSNSQQ